MQYSRKRLNCALLFALLTLATPLALAGPAAGSRVDILSTEITKTPQNQSLYLRRALAWADTGQPDKAMADVAMAEQLGDPLQATLVKGILLYRQQQLSAAKEAFDRYLSRYPDHLSALAYRARLLRDTGDQTGALIDYQHLLRLQPEQDSGTYLATAQLMASLPEQGVAQALALLDQRIAEVGALPQLQRYAIALEKQQGNYPGAVARLSTLDAKIRATPEWHVEVAELLLLSGEPGQAEPHLLVATEQLDTLRPTPARDKTRARASDLLQQANGAAR